MSPHAVGRMVERSLEKLTVQELISYLFYLAFLHRALASETPDVSDRAIYVGIGDVVLAGALRNIAIPGRPTSDKLLDIRTALLPSMFNPWELAQVNRTEELMGSILKGDFDAVPGLVRANPLLNAPEDFVSTNATYADA